MSAESIDTLIADIAKNNRECYRVKLAQFKGFDFVDLRVWYGPPDDRKPSGKGVAIRPDSLSAVIVALQEAQKRLAGAS